MTKFTVYSPQSTANENQSERAKPRLIQLAIGPDPSFPKRYRSAIARFMPLAETAYTSARGECSHRRVDLTFCPEAIELAPEILADYPVVSKSYHSATLSVQNRWRAEELLVYGRMRRSEILELSREERVAFAREALENAIVSFERWWTTIGSVKEAEEQEEKAREERRARAFVAARDRLHLILRDVDRTTSVELARGRFEYAGDEPTRIAVTLATGQHFKIAIDDVDEDTFGGTEEGS